MQDNKAGRHANEIRNDLNPTHSLTHVRLELCIRLTGLTHTGSDYFTMGMSCHKKNLC